MNGQGKLLTHYLKNADKLIIPVYQRNYDWREEHCKKLYQDLVRTIQNKKRWHFFGGIVSVSDPMGSSSDYLVIDGQQRKMERLFLRTILFMRRSPRNIWWMRLTLRTERSN